MPFRSPSIACWSSRSPSTWNPHLDRAARLAALLHDAPEYVVGDMISPFKAALGLDYKAFEKRLLAAIHIRFGLPPATPEKLEASIKKADRVAAYLEATQLAGFSIPEAEKFFGRPRASTGERLAEIPPPETAAAHRSRGALSQGLPEAERSMIIVCPLNKVRGAGASSMAHRMSSACSAPTRRTAASAASRPTGTCALTFHDIVQSSDGLQPASATDAERLVGFIADWPREKPLLIHCWAGISRSTAAAYTALCMLRPAADEEELAWELREASPSATPNRLIVSLADERLGRNGRMLSAPSNRSAAAPMPSRARPSH